MSMGRAFGRDHEQYGTGQAKTKVPDVTLRMFGASEVPFFFGDEDLVSSSLLDCTTILLAGGITKFSFALHNTYIGMLELTYKVHKIKPRPSDLI